jgi:hypothetical protein
MTFYYWKNGWTLDVGILDLLLGLHKPRRIRPALDRSRQGAFAYWNAPGRRLRRA